MKLNLGCGPDHKEGFVNVDLYCPNADLKHDLTKKLPFEDNTIEEIYASHVIEHFSEREWQEIIKDWYRVLIPYGIIEIKCPKIRVYEPNLAFDISSATCSWWIKTIDGNQKHEGHFHKNICSFDKLRMDLENVGFIGIKELQGDGISELRVRAMKNKINFDVIMIADSKNERLIKITQNAINSLYQSEEWIKFDVLIVETSGKDVKYNGALSIKYPFKEFNYNRALNLGINLTGNKYILLCNNDLIFEKGFATELLKHFQAGYQSLSPFCRKYHGQFLKEGDYVLNGYRVGQELIGWCIAIDRAIIRQIRQLDETCQFWYSDNIYAEQLKSKKIKHGLVCNSFVIHLGSKTLEGLESADQYYNLTYNQKQYFDNYPKVVL